MGEFFKKVIDATVQVACSKDLNHHESRIKGAFDRLIDFHKYKTEESAEMYKKLFMDECTGSQCSDAIRGIYDAMLRKGSFLECDFLESSYKGDATGSYEKGVRDQVVSKSAYLETLAVMGIMV